MKKELTIFYMNGCPYCKNARKALDELLLENPDYASVPVRWVNENESPEIVSQYSYYYVPTIFCDKEKVYEAHPGDSFPFIREQVKTALERAL